MKNNKFVIFGGDIVTLDERCPSAQAVAVADGKILAVGDRDVCASALGADHGLMDLKGSTLLPGFIDTHLHPILMIFFDLNTDLHGIDSIADLQDRLRNAAQTTPTDRWIVGVRFDEQDMATPRLPTRHDLDAASPDRPAIVFKHDGHMVIANTKAIEAAHISAATDDPPGGRIDRESDGFPAGPFRETASSLALQALPAPPMEDLIKGAASVFNGLASRGITSAGAVLQAGEEGPAGSAGAWDIPAVMLLLDHVPINLYSLLIAGELEQLQTALQTPLHSSEPGGHRIGGIKLFADGTFGSHTAFLSEPFADQPDKTGWLTMDEPEMYRRMAFAHCAGLQVAVHAIGDAAIRSCLNLFDRLVQQHPRADCRHRLEHASLVDASILHDIRRLGVVVSTQPQFIHSEKHWLHARLGNRRAQWTYPFRAFVDAGVVVAGASDAPIESTDVLHAIQCCVTREGFEIQQAITAKQAVRMFTQNAAYAQFEESVKGSLSQGKRADLVVLCSNPLACAPEKIAEIHVERTVCGGRVIYEG